MMSASSQLKAKPPVQRHLNGYSYLEGNPLINCQKRFENPDSHFQEGNPASVDSDTHEQWPSQPPASQLITQRSNSSMQQLQHHANSSSPPQAVFNKNVGIGGASSPHTSVGKQQKLSPCLKTLNDENPTTSKQSQIPSKVSTSLFSKSTESGAEQQVATSQKSSNKMSPKGSISTSVGSSKQLKLEPVGAAVGAGQIGKVSEQKQAQAINIQENIHGFKNAARVVQNFVRGQNLGIRTGGLSCLTQNIGNNSGGLTASSFTTQLPSPPRQPSPINHQSKFFELDQQPLTLQPNYSTHSSNNHKKRRFGQQANAPSSQSMPTHQKSALDIKEWFSSLSLDDRVLSLTIIDDFFAGQVQRMQSKIKKNGQGVFKFHYRTLKEALVKGPLQNEGTRPSIQKEFVYSSMKAKLKTQRDQMATQAKLISEKVSFTDFTKVQEFLDFVRITETDLETSNDLGIVTKTKCLNTITVSPTLVANPQLFYELIVKIVGHKFLKEPLSIAFSDSNNLFYTKTPSWFDSSEPSSLAHWIIFFLEISLQVHYLAYVNGLFTTQNSTGETTLNRDIFLKKSKQYINVKSELGQFWDTFCKGPDGQLQELCEKVFRECLKLEKSTAFQSEVSSLHGGLTEFAVSHRLNDGHYLQQECKQIELLSQNQEPQKFLQEVCMIPLDSVEDRTRYIVHKVLVEVLRDKAAKPGPQVAGAQSSKNKKKKDKKKEKKNKLKQQHQVTSAETQAEEEKKEEEEVKEVAAEVEEEEKEEQKVSWSEDEEDYLNSLQDKGYDDFCSNQQFITLQRDNYSPEERPVDDLLAELMNEPEVLTMPKFDKIKQEASAVAKVIPKPTPLLEHIVNEPVIELEKPKDTIEFHHIKQDGLASDDSTDDVIELHQLPVSSASEIKIPSPKGESGPQQIANQSKPQKKKANKSKKQPKKTEDGENRNREPSPVVNTIQIIRASKAALENSPVSKNDQQKKKKKKKAKTAANKPVPPAIPQSNVLNDFIKSKFKVDDEEEGINDDYDYDEQTSEVQQRLSRQNDQTGGKKNADRRNKDQSVKGKDDKSDPYRLQVNNYVVKQAPVYVKKGTVQKKDDQEETKEEQTLLTSSVVAEDLILKSNIEDFIDNFPSLSIQSKYESFIEHTEPLIEKLPEMALESQKSIDLSNSSPVPSSSRLQEKSTSQNQIKKKNGSNQANKKRSGNATQSSNGNQGNNRRNLGASEQGKKQNNRNQRGENMQLSNQQAAMYPSLMDPSSLASLLSSMTPYMDQNQMQQYPQQQIYCQQPQPELVQIIYQALQNQQSPQQVPFNAYGNQQYPQAMNDMHLQDFDISNSQQAVLQQEQECDAYYHMLDNQIRRMVKDIEVLLESVRKERHNAIQSIESIVKETYKNQYYQQYSFIGIKMYGSMASGLAIEQSDVDLAVVGLDLQGSKEVLLREMGKLNEQLDVFMKSKSSIKFIDTATVPVIKMTIDLEKVNQKILKRQGSSMAAEEQQTQIDPSMRYLGIDITFEDNSQHMHQNAYGVNQGIQCIRLIQELIERHPTLKPIVLVLKKILQTYNLNQPYLGGLNSYSLVLMTSTFLAHCGEVDSMSKNLSEVLHYFGSYFDPQTTYIEDFKLLSAGPGVLSDPMTVWDPLNKLNNITRSAFRIKDIQQIFKNAFQLLTHNKELFKQTYLMDGPSPNLSQFDDIILNLTGAASGGYPSVDGGSVSLI